MQVVYWGRDGNYYTIMEGIKIYIYISMDYILEPKRSQNQNAAPKRTRLR